MLFIWRSTLKFLSLSPRGHSSEIQRSRKGGRWSREVHRVSALASCLFVERERQSPSQLLSSIRRLEGEWLCGASPRSQEEGDASLGSGYLTDS